MGVVYRARQLALDRLVALKVLAPVLATDADFRERFEREVQIAAAIEHRHVVPVFEAGEQDGHLYLVMRWIEGANLAEILVQQGSLGPRRSARIVSQVAAALDAVHAHGLVHGDVKPRNVLIEGQHGNEHAYLTDFGVAGPLGSRYGVMSDGRWLGSPAYAAPEQQRGQPLDARADVYSLGCLLYSMLSGHALMAPNDATPNGGLADRPAVVTENDRRRSPTAGIAATLPAFDAVLRRALAASPGERFSSAGALADAVAAAANATGALEHDSESLLADRPTGATRREDAPPFWPTDEAPTTQLHRSAATLLQERRAADPDDILPGRSRRKRRRRTLVALTLAAGVALSCAALADDLRHALDSARGTPESHAVSRPSLNRPGPDAPAAPRTRTPPIRPPAPPRRGPDVAAIPCQAGDVLLIGTVRCGDARNVYARYIELAAAHEGSGAPSVDGILGSWRCFSPFGGIRVPIIRCEDAISQRWFSAFD